jgi:hypothetical protein
MEKILSLIVYFLLFKLMEWWYAHAYGQSDELMVEETCDWYPEKVDEGNSDDLNRKGDQES